MDSKSTSKNEEKNDDFDLELSKKSSPKHKKSKKKDRKRKHSSSSDDSEDHSPKRSKSKHKKKCKKRHKHSKAKKNKHHKDKYQKKEVSGYEKEDAIIGPEIPRCLNKIPQAPEIPKAQSMAPMSKKEWEKRRNTYRRVFDEETGRTRLIRGEGEVIEEIVSRERHKEINRQATLGDGVSFQSKLKKCL